MDILTGSGEIVTASPDGDHADLFEAFPNSYGSLGYATRLKIKLEKVPPFVALRHLHFSDASSRSRRSRPSPSQGSGTANGSTGSTAPPSRRPRST
ncbi:hypothetical protein [Aeromicrobium sp. UC242_57]|uniref:hypothetical protein n=1 Tax=Aeromicrobium sp. UC242_57 TaxID=3374624 RepID=UPI0037B61499